MPPIYISFSADTVQSLGVNRERNYFPRLSQDGI